MQTNFTAEQLADPDTRRANEVLRACVHCGFCTATCPTYQVLGDELDSPRGRIYLMKEMLENDRPADAETVKHLDRCLSCLACMTTCPSGVHYMHLVDHARAHVERTYRRPWRDRALRGLLAAILPHPRRFRLAVALGRLARPFARVLPDARLRAMVEMAPASRQTGADVAPGIYPAEGPRRMRVALMPGCAQTVLNPGINRAALRLLTRLGAEVVVAPGLGCCGALVHHMGKTGASHAAARGNIAAWEAAGDLDAIALTTSGCGTTVKDYGHMLRNAPEAAAAARISSLTRDITEVLSDLFPGDAPIGPPNIARGDIAGIDAATEAPVGSGLRVVYHAACSLQHGQRIRTAPKRLLARAGFEVVEPADSHLCCGSAGTYNLLQPEIAGQLKARKVRSIEDRDPDIVAAGNIGCMMQIGSGTERPVVHTVELLDWATGGPRPAGLPR